MSEDLPYLHESTEESSRILSYQDAQRLIREYREQGIRVVLVHGVFDVLHIGHEMCIRDRSCHHAALEGMWKFGKNLMHHDLNSKN